jgi:hypothetical protein
MRFNMRRVPRSVRGNETLVEMVAEYTAKFQTKDYRKGLCYHEAGHALFAEQYGSERAVFEAPLAFTYDKFEDSFMFDEARVYVNVPRYWRDDAKQMLAGKVVERAFTPKAHWSNEECYVGDFHYVYAALKHGHVAKTKWASFIKRLESEIRRDLRNPTFRKAIERRAIEYQRILEKSIKKSISQTTLDSNRGVAAEGREHGKTF